MRAHSATSAIDETLYPRTLTPSVASATRSSAPRVGAASAASAVPSDFGLRSILVCLDRSPAGEGILAHAAAIAKCFGARLTLFHVADPRRRLADASPTDPFTWDLRCAEIRDYLGRLAVAMGAMDAHGLSVEVDVAQGSPATQIRAFAKANDVSLVALTTHGEGGIDNRCLGSTARKLIESLPRSLMLVPSAVASPLTEGPARYARILVPLDGSPRAESVLPVAAALARANAAELLLAHAVPVAALTQTAPPSVDDQELVRRIHDRNARAGTTYLSALAARLSAPSRGASLSVRTSIVEGEDSRTALVRLAEHERADLVVAASHGATSSLDRACGSVAAHLLERSPLPLLLVRDLETGPQERAMPRGATTSSDAPLPQAQSPRLPGLEFAEEA